MLTGLGSDSARQSHISTLAMGSQGRAWLIWPIRDKLGQVLWNHRAMVVPGCYIGMACKGLCTLSSSRGRSLQVVGVMWTVCAHACTLHGCLPRASLLQGLRFLSIEGCPSRCVEVLRLCS